MSEKAQGEKREDLANSDPFLSKLKRQELEQSLESHDKEWNVLCATLRYEGSGRGRLRFRP